MAALAAPASAQAIRYASPTGTAVDDCQTPATACNLEVAIEGDGAANNPTNGEEIVILTGSYPSQTTEIFANANNLNIHGEGGQPRPVINQSVIGRLSVGNDTLSYLHFESTMTTESVNQSGIATIDRVSMRGTANAVPPICQCYGGVVRNSVFVTNGQRPALGIHSNGGSASVTYRNVTAYSSHPTTPAISVSQIGMSGTLDATIINSIALNANGAEVEADGHGAAGATITFTRSNYRAASEVQGGVIEDSPGDTHQTALPTFVSPAMMDFTQVAGSPTIDAGLDGPLNGTADFAGNSRALGTSTDIGAHEFVPPTANPPATNPPAQPPGTSPTRKCKPKKRKKAGAAAKKRKGCKKKKKRK